MENCFLTEEQSEKAHFANISQILEGIKKELEGGVKIPRYIDGDCIVFNSDFPQTNPEAVAGDMGMVLDLDKSWLYIVWNKRTKKVINCVPENILSWI